jgi:hypothetical protein
VKKIIKKKIYFRTFRGKPTLYPLGEKVNIMADSNFVATFQKIGVYDEFDIKYNI